MILCSALDYYAKESEFYFRKKKVHDLRLINLSHPAHFKELQNYFEVYLLLMTFLTRKGGHLPTHWHNDRVSIYMMFYKWICGTKKAGQNGSLTFLYYGSWRHYALPFILKDSNWRKKIERKPKCRFTGRKKNEGRNFCEHLNRAHWIMCSELNLCKTNTTKPLAFPLAKSEPLTNPGYGKPTAFHFSLKRNVYLNQISKGKP